MKKEFEEYVMGLDSEKLKYLFQTAECVAAIIPPRFAEITLIEMLFVVTHEAASFEPDGEIPQKVDGG